MKSPFAALLFDLDGTVYRGQESVPGAPELLDRLRRAGVPFLYFTNRATRSAAAVCEQIRGYGLGCEPEEVLTSAVASARRMAGGRVYMVGEEGLEEALLDAGCELVEEDAEWVVVGLDRQVTYDKIDTAARLVRSGARFVATNPDKMFQTHHGLAAGAGALVAAVATVCGVEPEVIGKPGSYMFKVALEQLGQPAERVLMVGDNLETDILGGLGAGLRTALMLTGVARREDVARLGIDPHHVCADFEELTELVLPVKP